MTLLEHIKDIKPAISVNNDFLFFFNGKVATQSSVRTALKGMVFVSKIKRTKYKSVLDSYSLSDIKRMFKFTIVRNPWDRVVSGFFFFQQRRRRNYRFIGKNETFNKFVKTRLLECGIGMNKYIKDHFGFQHPKVMFKGNVFVDFIGRLESIERDWKIISSAIGCSPDFPHINKSNRGHYRDYYDDETRDIIADIYATDIELFGYEF